MNPDKFFTLLALSAFIGVPRRFSPPENFNRFIAAVIGVLSLLILLLIASGDRTHLEILEASVQEGEQEVPTQTQITFLFNRPIDAKSIESHFILNPPVEGYYSAVGRRFAFTPKYGFIYETLYTLTLQKEAKDLLGREMSAGFETRFSTKKRYLAYLSSQEGEKGRVYRIHPGGQEKWPMTEPEEVVKVFAVSPDGKNLAYAISTSDPLRPDKLYLKNLETGKKNEISLPGPLDLSAPQFSPDGNLLGFIGATVEDGTIRSDWAVYLANLGEPSLRAVKFDFSQQVDQSTSSALLSETLKRAILSVHLKRETFTFSPDGGALVLRDKNGDFSLVTPTQDSLTGLGPYLEVGNFNATGDKIAFVDLNPADPELKGKILIHSATGAAQEISDPSLDNMDPRFAHRSPTKMVYAAGIKVSDTVRLYHLELVDLMDKNPQSQGEIGPTPTALTKSSDHSDEHPVWSPDDQWIAFERFSQEELERVSTSPLSKEAHRGGEIWVIKADGSQLHSLGARGTNLVWIP